MNKDQFYTYILHPELLNDRSTSNIKDIIEEYPYFQSAHLLHIKNLHNQGSISYDRELRKTAVYITDRSRLFYLLDKRVLLSIDDYVTEKEYPEIDAAIDFSALENVTEFTSIGNAATKKLKEQKEDDELSQLIMSGATQSSTFFNVNDKVDLEDFINTFKKKKPGTDSLDKKENDLEHHKGLIDSFIDNQPKIVPNENTKEITNYNIGTENTDEPDMITDTLAKIYINQGKYEKAILAYEKLSLKYPEKNIYFAGQIQKIKELINNQ